MEETASLPAVDYSDRTIYDESIDLYKDEIVCGFRGDMPNHLYKYWHNRNNLFTRYDEGCVIDEGM